MMIEPTESEDKAEMDRFIDSMIAIKEEIHLIETGEYDRTKNPLKVCGSAHAFGPNFEHRLTQMAPHTLKSLLVTEWNRPYTREMAGVNRTTVQFSSKNNYS